MRVERFRVPADYTESGGPSLDIEYGVRRTAPGNRRALLFLAGGPGGDAFDLDEVIATQIDPLPSGYDLVFYNVRGAGSKNVRTEINCASANRDWYPDGELRRDIQKRCLDEVDAKITLRTLNTANFARDIDALLVDLGYEQWIVYGESYGTGLALELMRRYPQRLEAVVLDGSLPPAADFISGYGRRLEESMYDLFEQCELDAACNGNLLPPGYTFAQSLSVLVDRARAGTWAVTLRGPSGEPVSTVVDDAILRSVLGLLLRQWNTRVAVLRIVAESALGSDDLITRILQWLYEQENVFNIEEFVNDIVICNEYYRYDMLSAAELEALDDGFFGSRGYEGTAEGCREVLARIPEEAVEILPTPVNSSVRTLVLCGEDDPVTPEVWARDVASHLENGELACLPFQGHGVLWSKCGGDLVQQFVNAPGLPLDRSCIESSEAPWQPTSSAARTAALRHASYWNPLEELPQLARAANPDLIRLIRMLR